MVDGIVGILQFAVDGLTEQQQATANDVANVDTPGFTAQNVDFETSLQQALSSPNGGPATISVTPSTNTPGTNGNNVDLPAEMTTLDQATMQYQTMSQLLTSQFKLVSDALSAGGPS